MAIFETTVYGTVNVYSSHYPTHTNLGALVDAVAWYGADQVATWETFTADELREAVAYANAHPEAIAAEKRRDDEVDAHSVDIPLTRFQTSSTRSTG